MIWRRVNRRCVLGAGLAAAAGPGLSGLVACSGASSRTADPGLLRVGIAGDSTATVGDPRASATGADFAAVLHIYDSLVRVRDGRYQYQLAESIEPAADAASFTIRVRAGVRFHNGQTMTAADVAYSLRVLADPKHAPGFSLTFVDVDAPRIRVIDERTVMVPLKRPRADFVESTLAVASPVFPNNGLPDHIGVGTGPYRLESVAKGESISLVAFDGYWAGKPAIERIRLVRIADATARLNGLLAAQLDYATAITAAGARAQEGNSGVAIQRADVSSSNAVTLSMNQHKRPFDDPRVREAVCLVIDRESLVASLLSGIGKVGNDIVGRGFAGYAADIPQRGRDVARARSLFSSAGVDRLRLLVSDVVPGMGDGAQLLVRQFAEARVRLAIARLDAGDTTTQRNSAFQTFLYVNRSPATHLGLMTGPAATFNPAGYGPDWFSALADAQNTVAAKARARKFHRLQQQAHRRCAEAVWGYQQVVAAAKPGLAGVGYSQSVPLFDQARFR